MSREFNLDLKVVGFAFLASLLTGLLAGSLPAIQAMGRNVMEILKSDSVEQGPSRRFLGKRVPGVRDFLMSAQVALSVVLLVVSGLVLKTLGEATAVDPGFEYEQLIGSHISTSSTGVQPEGREQFFRELEAQISREPWVVSATFSANAPLSGHGSVNVRVAGQDEPTSSVMSQVHDGFFEKLGIDLLEGRTFETFDTAGGAPVVVLNRPAADQYFPEGRATGGTIWIVGGNGQDQAYEVAGVVGDVKVRDFLGPVEPTVFLPFSQGAYGSGAGLLVTTVGSPEESVPLLHQWLRAYEPHLAIVNAITYKDVVGGALYTQRMNAEMFSALAILGLILAGVGIFSVVSLSVSRRTREIGVRKAIGATGGGDQSVGGPSGAGSGAFGSHGGVGGCCGCVETGREPSIRGGALRSCRTCGWQRGASAHGHPGCLSPGPAGGRGGCRASVEGRLTASEFAAHGFAEEGL